MIDSFAAIAKRSADRKARGEEGAPTAGEERCPDQLKVVFGDQHVDQGDGIAGREADERIINLSVSITIKSPCATNLHVLEQVGEAGATCIGEAVER